MKSQWFTLSLLSMSSLSAFGQGFQDAQNMDEMVVTATRIEQNIKDVPITTQVITREEIELSGATNLGDILGTYVTGHYHKYNGMLSPVGIRGFRTESHGDDIKGHVLILVDGHRTGTGNAAKINPDRIERIEIIKGPSSALYGSAAMGGVINIITKKGTGAVNATVKGTVGSFDYRKGELSSGGVVNDQIRYHVTASYETVGDYSDPLFGTVYNTSETKKNIGGNITYALDADNEFRFGGNFADLTGEYPSWLDGTYSSYDPNADQNYDKSNGYADFEYNGHYLEDTLHYRAQVYYLWDRNHWNYGPDGIPESEQSKYTDTTWGTDQQLIWTINDQNKLLGGFTLQRLEKKSEGVSGGEPSAPYTPNMEYNTQALYFEDTTSLLDDRINIVLAGRYDRFDSKTLTPETGVFEDFNETSEVYDHFSPKFAIGYKFLDDTLRLRANIGTGFKTPSADQLSADYVQPSTGVHYLGNPYLKPETSRTYGIGFDIFQDNLVLNLDYFYTDFSDKIVSQSLIIDDERISTYKNSGDAVIAGFEMLLQWRQQNLFNTPLNATFWANAEINTQKEDKTTGKDLQYISDYELKGGITANYERYSGQLNFVLVGPQLITNYDTYEDEEKGSFSFWNLTGGYNLNGDGWNITASVLNLFNQDVQWVRGYIMPERNYRLSVAYRF